MVVTMPTSSSSRRAGYWARLDQPLNPIPLAAGLAPGVCLHAGPLRVQPTFP